MNQNVLTDIGENFEYAKTIMRNEVELKKLDLIESSAGVVGMIASGLIVVFTLLVVFMFAMVLLTIVLANALGSLIHALLILGTSFLILGLVVFLFRKSLIIKPIVNLFYKQIID